MLVKGMGSDCIYTRFLDGWVLSGYSQTPS